MGLSTLSRWRLSRAKGTESGRRRHRHVRFSSRSPSFHHFDASDSGSLSDTSDAGSYVSDSASYASDSGSNASYSASDTSGASDSSFQGGRAWTISSSGSDPPKERKRSQRRKEDPASTSRDKTRRTDGGYSDTRPSGGILKHGSGSSRNKRRGKTNRSLVSPQNLEFRLQKWCPGNTAAPKSDNFYTPENHDFYSRSPYLPLDTKRREIRLLRVHPRRTTAYEDQVKHSGQRINPTVARWMDSSRHRLKAAPPTMLSCELIDKVQLSRVDGTYCAISYCAGQVTNPKVILIDGIPFKAFANLEHAISQLLDYWTVTFPGKDLLLWADQVCINQGDHAERASQVGLMRDIYRRSGTTFICLSNPELSRCLSWVSPFVSSSAATGEEKESMPTASYRLKRHLRSMLLVDTDRSQDQLHSWLDSLHAFMTSPWWRRAWVYQEFIVSPWPSFLSGSTCVSWQELSPVMDFVSSELGPFLSALHSEIDCEEETRHGRMATEKIAWDKETRHRTRGRGKEGFELGHEKKSGAETRRNVPHEGIIHALFKDRINALDTTHHRKPHEQQTSEVWARGRTQRGPQRVQPRDEPRTTHSPGTQEPADRRRPRDQNKSQTRMTDGPGGERPPMREQVAQRRVYPPDDHGHGSKKRLKIQSLQSRLDKLDTSSVESVCKGKNAAGGPSQGLATLLQHSRNCESSDPRDRIYAFLGLASKEYGIVPDYGRENTVVHALLHASRRIIEHDENLHVLEHVHRGRERLSHFLPTWVPDWTSRDTGSELSRYITSRTEAEDHKDQSFDASKRQGTGGVQFRSEDSQGTDMDLKVKGILVGVLDKHDGPVPGFPGLEWLSCGVRRVAATQSALVGDEVWVLYGAKMPVVLRHDDDMYSFLGEVLVCESDGRAADVMYGNMVDLANTGMVEAKEIWLI